MKTRAWKPGWLERRLAPRSGPFPGELRLDRRRIYILPSRAGLVFALTLLVMLFGSINYGKSLGFVLTFLLAGIGVAAMHQTHQNLLHLLLRAGEAAPVFAGGMARFAVQLRHEDDEPRHSIGLSYAGVPAGFVDVPPATAAWLRFELPAPRRGWLHAGRVKLYTEFPLGLLHAWTWADLSMRVLVYPRPEAGGVPPPQAVLETGEGASQGAGAEDFSGVRGYQPGDPPRHIAWKQAARSGVLHTKQFAGAAPTQQWLDFEALPGMDMERRLSRLTRWVLDAESAGIAYGLRLPGLEIPPALGAPHQARCLEALALHGL
jgi:uncharacterized protein (DUF58 family)